MKTDTIGIIGGGISGPAVGRQIILRQPGTRVVVFEQEDALAQH